MSETGAERMEGDGHESPRAPLLAEVGVARKWVVLCGSLADLARRRKKEGQEKDWTIDSLEIELIFLKDFLDELLPAKQPT